MSEPKAPLTGEDVELIAKTFGQKPSDSLRKKVMEGLDRIDDQIAKGIDPRQPTQEKSRTPEGRGGIGD